MLKRTSAIMLGLAVACSPVVGAAEGRVSEEQSAEETQQKNRLNKKRSVKLFKEGYDAYSNQNWTAALRLWREAHTFNPDARFLLNAAKAAKRAGNLEQGLGLVEKAMDEDREAFALGPDQVGEAKDLKKELQKRIEERERERALAAEKGLHGKGWSGVGAVAVGGGLIGLGLGLFGQNVDSAREEARAADTFSSYQENIETFERAQRNGRISLYTGIGVAAVGTSLIVWDLVESKQARSKLSLGSRGADVGATLQVSF